MYSLPESPHVHVHSHTPSLSALAVLDAGSLPSRLSQIQRPARAGVSTLGGDSWAAVLPLRLCSLRW